MRIGWNSNLSVGAVRQWPMVRMTMEILSSGLPCSRWIGSRAAAQYSYSYSNRGDPDEVDYTIGCRG